MADISSVEANILRRVDISDSILATAAGSRAAANRITLPRDVVAMATFVCVCVDVYLGGVCVEIEKKVKN
jgi:hypothetical protein